MRVIPAINCSDAASVRLRMETVKTFLPPGELLHIDVTDGIFTGHVVWADPIVWGELHGSYGLEVHFMVEQPEEYIEAWAVAGMKRCIIHVEAINSLTCHEIVSRCAADNIEVLLSLNPDTPSEAIHPYRAMVSGFHVLAVHPGAAGQEFLPEVIEKIYALRDKEQDAIIEVDGGMNPLTAQLVKDAGADTIVSASYIFGSADPKKAYGELSLY